MIAPIRPRIATVVSVIWLYLGPSWTLVGVAGLASGAAVLSLLPDPGDAEMEFFGLPAFFLGAAVSGVKFPEAAGGAAAMLLTSTSAVALFGGRQTVSLQA